MLKDIKRLIKQSAVYGIGVVAQPLIGFILLPVYTRYMPPDDYGVLALTNIMTLLLVALLGLGVNSGMLRIYYNYKTKEEQNRVISTSLLFSFFATVAFLVLFLPLAGIAGPVLFEVPESAVYFRIIVITVGLNIFGNNLLGVLRTEEKAKIYTAFTITTMFIYFGLNILFLVFLEMGVQGVLEATMYNSLINIFILFPFALKGKKFEYSKKMIRQVINFGAPLIPALIADLFLNFSDRYFIDHYFSKTEVGLYSLGYRLGGMVSVFISKPFKIAWPPYMYQVAHQENAKEIYKNVLRYYSFIALFIGLAISVFSKEALIILTTHEYIPAHKVVPLITLSYILFGMVAILIAGIHITKKTKYASFFTITAAASNFGMNFFLIPAYGMMGAAVSTIISYIILNASVFYVSQKLYPIRHDYLRLFQIFAYAAVFYIIGTIPPFTQNFIVVLLYKSVIVLLYPVALYYTGFLKKFEKNFIQKLYYENVIPVLERIKR